MHIFYRTVYRQLYVKKLNKQFSVLNKHDSGVFVEFDLKQLLRNLRLNAGSFLIIPGVQSTPFHVLFSIHAQNRAECKEDNCPINSNAGAHKQQQSQKKDQGTVK
jgi:hypothetical protein